MSACLFAGCMDCDDGDPAIHPGAREQCDGKDNDCSGLVDDGPSCECSAAVAGSISFSLCALPMSWEQAAQFCAARGQMLARIHSREIAKELHAAASALRLTTWWVGLNDHEREGAFHWQDGSRARRSLWSRDEPDNYACDQHCAALTETTAASCATCTAQRGACSPADRSPRPKSEQLHALGTFLFATGARP